MKRTRRKSSVVRGFTLLETIVALTVLAIAAVGTLAGLISASDNIRRGQMRQYKTALVEAHMQAVALADKSLVTSGTWPFVTPVAYTTPPAQMPIGGGIWTLDDENAYDLADPHSLTKGAFFRVTETGVITPVDPASIGNPATCAYSPLVAGLLCREVAVTDGMPNDGGAPASGGTAYTVWTRVVREGDPSPSANPSMYAVVDREVIFQ